MVKRCNVFEATIDEEGEYVCLGDPVKVQQDDIDVPQHAEQLRDDRESDRLMTNSLFMENYLRNVRGEQHELLRQSQEGLLDLQREILRNIRRT
ncbi:hypothetical protein [Aurantivibrio plasticivorans]